MPFFSWAQITYFGSASNPGDPGVLSSAIVAVTPPGSMRQGDLVIMVGLRRASNITLTVSATGGQIWNELPILTGTANVSPRIFWCRFNGTWSANPSVNMGAATANTVIMHVFRPPTPGFSWAIDVAQAQTASAAAATITRTGVTTIRNQTVTLAAWFTADDNQWGAPSAGWTNTGAAQYRNAVSGGGNPQSCATFAHQIRTTAGGTGNVSKTQTSQGSDPTRTAIVSFYSYRTSMPQMVLD